MTRTRRTLTPLPLLTLALTACGTGTGSLTIIGVVPRAELTVEVTGLPSGEAADVAVQHGTLIRSLAGPQVLRDLPLGRYDVSARTVVSDGAPYQPVVEPRQVTFDKRHLRATVKVKYDLPLTGQLTLNVAGMPEGQETTLHITGPNGFKRDLRGEATQTLADLAPGDYNVTAEAVRSGDFTYPATMQGAPVRVQRGRTSVVNVAFARDPRFGHLAVRVLGLPEGVPGVLKITDGAGGFRTQVGSGIVTDLPQGDTRVVPSDTKAGGMTYRAPAMAINVPGASVAMLDVSYAAVTGRLQVVVNSPVPVPAGSISVTGGHGLNATTTLDDLAPGTYAVSARSFTTAGWTYVPEEEPAQANVQAGRTAGVTVTYVPQVAQPGVERDFMAPQVILETERLGEDRVLRGRATDAGGIAHVTVYLGSQVLGEATVDSQGDWSLAWPEAPQGEHEVTVVAADLAGNEAQVTRTVMVGH